MIALVLRELVPLKFNGVFPVLDICLMDASFSFLFDMHVLLQQLCNIDFIFQRFLTFFCYCTLVIIFVLHCYVPECVL